ncbi:hypothetical protein INT46_011847 [Mucor plumbeus]|uniref:Uncharacterized protein n=1 Tax=Mucor plumbeus TaxID=97098 RepID=A0A8H7QFU7_9FUNG|nr:hypothetical protein INT46_011847 [Mucor plumbeus]
MGLKPRQKINTNFISKRKQASSAGMGQRTSASYSRPVEAVGWSDGGDILQPYQIVIRFQQDNATPHASEITQDWFGANGIISETNRDWPAARPDLNPIEHF